MKRTTETLAERLMTRRRELGLRQTDVAEVAGVSEAAVSQWEKGQTKNLRLDHLFKVADLLRVSARWLGVGEGPKFVSILFSLLIPPLLSHVVRLAGCVLCQIRRRHFKIAELPLSHSPAAT